MKKAKQNLLKHRICQVARVTTCVSFIVLAIIGVSSLVRAMSLSSITHENGIPSSWDVASLGNPETITVPISYWDQKQDDCDDPNRQFEWTICGYWTAGAVQGIVKDHLGKDGLPIPTYTNSTDAWKAKLDVFTANVTGHDPVDKGDNFYRWFHDTDVSQRYDSEITFKRTGENSYTYGGQNIFPVDDVDFSDGDQASDPGHSDDGKDHNFHFTAHLRIPIKVSADGSEVFEFSGDDDVWVFLNGKLVLDIGGLHEAIDGSFRINADGTVTSNVSSVNDTTRRTQLGKPNTTWPHNYVNDLSALNSKTCSPQGDRTIDVGIKEGDVVNLDFFYAERSTTASNTKITITGMNWPISADSKLDGEIVGKVENGGNLIEYNASITNRDPDNELDLKRLAAFIKDTSTTTDDNGNPISDTDSGFIPLSIKTLAYTKTPNDEKSWQNIEISAPLNSTAGFTLAEAITMAPYGNDGDTLYFRYGAETSSNPSGTITALTSFYTELRGVSGVAYDRTQLTYSNQPTVATPTVTVRYVYDNINGAEAHEPISQQVTAGTGYSIESPEIDGYTPDQPVVSGTMPATSVTFTVIYTKDTPVEPEPVEPDPVEPEPADPVEPEEPDPVPHRLTILYLDEDDHELVTPYEDDLIVGDTYSITSPDIEGYTTTRTTVSGEMPDDDYTERVIYAKVIAPEPEQPTPAEPDAPSQPTTPVQPEIPEVPAEPDTPDVPIIPSDIIDDDLINLAPLGEVAFVPNTGIIDEFVAPIFEQYFASAILSQGFVLTALLIFAGSFATYFSLRKYLNLDLATRSANNRKPRPMPKNANSMKRALAKSARSAAKTTSKASAKATKTTKSAAKTVKSVTKTAAKTAKSTPRSSAKTTPHSTTKSTAAKAKSAAKTKK